MKTQLSWAQYNLNSTEKPQQRVKEMGTFESKQNLIWSFAAKHKHAAAQCFTLTLLSIDNYINTSFYNTLQLTQDVITELYMRTHNLGTI